MSSNTPRDALAGSLKPTELQHSASVDSGDVVSREYGHLNPFTGREIVQVLSTSATAGVESGLAPASGEGRSATSCRADGVQISREPLGICAKAHETRILHKGRPLPHAVLAGVPIRNVRLIDLGRTPG